ncbi:MAG: DivIVA domain-containing protein [Bowdeniella nasicola]|nr:DivIVA domain-containing protein [Bowdeniella nasicola]
MALLTADDVLNKKFEPTKFREGYNQEEVDDFLDEVVVTLRTITAENEELKAKLAAAERRIGELGSMDDRYSPVEDSAPVGTPAEEPVEEPVVESSRSAESAAGMLALAQRLHDEYVRNGQDESERIVAEARERGDSIIKEAEDKYNNTLAQLESERSQLERKIDELRAYERDYRSRMKSYLEGLLRDVEATPEGLN